MKKEFLIEECNKILNFWKLEEYFTPMDYPKLVLKVREGNKNIPFDAYYNTYGSKRLPLKVYKAHNDYLKLKNKPDGKLYNRANLYCGCYKIKTFIEKMAEKCKLDMDKYTEISELLGRFYIFSIQIDLDGKLTEEGVKISPFFYAVLCMIKEKCVNVSIDQENISKLNEDINEILVQNDIQFFEFTDIDKVKDIVFDKLGVKCGDEIGLEASSDETYACKGLRKEEESSDFLSFYLDEIEYVQKNFKKNYDVIKYTTSLLADNSKKIMIDSDISQMKKWLEVDRFPLAKYPSKFFPTLMQQLAINIAISEKDRNENIFSVNGPPGTGKTTLLKEIIASNVFQLAEVLIKYGINSDDFVSKKIESASNATYIEKYYEIPEEIAKFGILVVSNNNGAVENITLDLPKYSEMQKDKTRTNYFDREINSEVYFSKVADNILEQEGGAWGLISARMGRKSYVDQVLRFCVFSRKTDNSKRITLDSQMDNNLSWNEAVEKFNKAKNKVLSIREDIKNDQSVLADFYRENRRLTESREMLKQLIQCKEEIGIELVGLKNELGITKKEIFELEEEINYIKLHSTFLNKISIFFGLGKNGKYVAEKKKCISQLLIKHSDIEKRYRLFKRDIEKLCSKIEKNNNKVSMLEKKVCILNEKVYGDKGSLKSKYRNNLPGIDFYEKIKENENSQSACPWVFDEYDIAREELFYASLQVRKAFILNSPYIKRNLFVYEGYVNGKYKDVEKKEMFSHLFNSLSIVIPVLSSTFASIGRFLKHAGNKSLGMLIVDESGQATPQSALGALYRTKRAIVVGDPLQVEPIVTIPQVLIDMLADNAGVPKLYKLMENSVQTFADNINEFNGMIGERRVGCPLVVHRRCIEPMFSISNMISYDNRMFNKTNKKEEYLMPEQTFLIKKSGWINVKGEEEGSKNHFVKNQAIMVCKLIEDALDIYGNLFETDDKIFIITPFRTVAQSMRKFIINYFSAKVGNIDVINKWTKNCVGTVHTFQGKDANEVLFVLGCSSQSAGAMNWVVKKANILNVAATRAKYRIAFIGNIDDWKNRRSFEDFIPELIDIIDYNNV